MRRLQVLRVEPGDTLVLSVDHMPAEHMERLRNALAGYFQSSGKPVGVVVIDKGIEVAAIRIEKEEEQS